MPENLDQNIQTFLEGQELVPLQYFGYGNESDPEASRLELPQEGLLCMVSEIVEKNLSLLIQETGLNFRIGDWFLSEVIEGRDHKVHGPFNSQQHAFDFGRTQFGAISYRSA